MSAMIWQLRTEADETIRDVVNRLALSILESLCREIDYCDPSPQNWLVVQAPVVKVLADHLKAHDECGQHPVCTSGVYENADLEPDDRIYLLELGEGLEGLAEKICRQVLQTLSLPVDEVTFQSLNSRMQSGVFRLLKTLARRNVACGQHIFCSQTHPIDPWKGLKNVWQ